MRTAVIIRACPTLWGGASLFVLSGKDWDLHKLREVPSSPEKLKQLVAPFEAWE